MRDYTTLQQSEAQRKKERARRSEELAEMLTANGFTFGPRDADDAFSSVVVFSNGVEIAGSADLIEDYLTCEAPQMDEFLKAIGVVSSLEQTARRYIAAGLVIARTAICKKYPATNLNNALSGWEQMTLADSLEQWKPTIETDLRDAIGIVCGAVSGGVEVLDFDQGGIKFEPWKKLIEPDLFAKMVVERTQSGGYHVGYISEVIEGTLILAGSRKKTLIETRADGNFCVCAPSPRYVLLQRSWDNLQTITADERETLLDAARAQGEMVSSPVEVEWTKADDGNDGDDGESPWDKYNREATHDSVVALLVEAGWTECGNGHLTRPGKEFGVSGSVGETGGFYCFTTSDELFEVNRSYTPFGVFAAVRHGGDFTAAGRALAAEYGMVAEPARPLADVLAMIEYCRKQREAAVAAEKPPATPGFTLLSVSDLRQQFPTERIPIIDGLLRRGETMNIIGAAKSRKTWLLLSLILSVASGREWMGHSVRQGKVLHFDNELHGTTINKRINKVAAGMGLTDADYADNYRCRPLRGQLLNLTDIAKRLEGTIQPGECSLIVIDALYKALPPYMRDENDNAGLTRVYCELDQLAERMGCAIVVVHHQSKGKQNEKKVTDVGSGAGAQSRSVDCHLVIREHRDPDSVVMEAVARDFPPSPPVVLRWNYPIYTADLNANPALLKDLATEIATMPMDAFVDRVVGPKWAQKGTIEAKAQKAGISLREAARLLGDAIRDELIELRGGKGGVVKEYRAITINNDVPF